MQVKVNHAHSLMCVQYIMYTRGQYSASFQLSESVFCFQMPKKNKVIKLCATLAQMHHVICKVTSNRS